MEMDRIAVHLAELGYKRGSARIYLGRLAHFSAFAACHVKAEVIGPEVVESYLRSRRTAASRKASRTVIGHARRIAPERFSIPRGLTPPHQPLLDAYLVYLREVRGLAPKTCEGLLLAARRVLAWYDRHCPDQPLAAMTGAQVLALVEYVLSGSSNSTTRTSAISYLRRFLRFLYWTDRIGQDLARFVPHTPSVRLAHIPPRLAWEDVRRAIDAIDTTTPVGVRNRALMLLLATTGLRNKELRSLELSDIQWRQAAVLIRRTKARRDRVVPLLAEAGEALADYVLLARPQSDSARVFLQHVGPVRPINCSGVISGMVRSVLERSGLALPRVAGAHLIRHSLATQLVGQRRPINEVADLLGHRSIDTTAIYVKVAVAQLGDVALPFPGGAS
jgi:site-specific recombinase XerD